MQIAGLGLRKGRQEWGVGRGEEVSPPHWGWVWGGPPELEMRILDAFSGPSHEHAIEEKFN